MKRGDIVLVRYPFTDLSSEKLRPAMILLPENERGDFLLSFITSSLTESSLFDISLLQGEGGLKRDSILRLQKIMTIHKSLLVGRIGSLPPHKVREAELKLKTMLEL